MFPAGRSISSRAASHARQSHEDCVVVCEVVPSCVFLANVDPPRLAKHIAVIRLSLRARKGNGCSKTAANEYLMQRHRDPLRRRCSANFSSDLLHTITTLIVVTVNLSLVACQAVADGPGNAERKPNLVFILADDKYECRIENAVFCREIA